LLTLCDKRCKHASEDVAAAGLGEGGSARDVDINVVGIGDDGTGALKDEDDVIFNRKALGNLESVVLYGCDVGHRKTGEFKRMGCKSYLFTSSIAKNIFFKL
jgi:hypothetical protein